MKKQSTIRAFVRLSRPHQWVKNTLVFIPLIAAHAYGDPGLNIRALLYFVAFCLASSGVYALNDVSDREHDQSHPGKKFRPVAAGSITPFSAIIFGIALLSVGLVAAAFCSPLGAVILGVYLVLNWLYSRWLKSSAILDVFVLAGFYMVRVFGGAAAVMISVSEWLLAFVGFFFLGLAFLKRSTEIRRYLCEIRDDSGTLNGRSYRADDLPVIGRFGTSSGFLSCLILALYVQSPAATGIYPSSLVLWLGVPILLFWTCRIWLLEGRGEMDDDPILFAVKDPTSWTCIFLMTAIAITAKIG